MTTSFQILSHSPVASHFNPTRSSHKAALPTGHTQHCKSLLGNGIPSCIPWRAAAPWVLLRASPCEPPRRTVCRGQSPWESGGSICQSARSTLTLANSNTVLYRYSYPSNRLWSTGTAIPVTGRTGTAIPVTGCGGPHGCETFRLPAFLHQQYSTSSVCVPPHVISLQLCTPKAVGI
jgi:hypothetical protein